MNILQTATFSIGLDLATDDDLEAAAAAFTCTLHRRGLTPADAFDAWRRLDAWEAARFAPEGDPGPRWRLALATARDALVAALAAAGAQGQSRHFVIRSPG